VNRYKLCFFNF